MIDQAAFIYPPAGTPSRRVCSSHTGPSIPNNAKDFHHATGGGRCPSVNPSGGVALSSGRDANGQLAITTNRAGEEELALFVVDVPFGHAGQGLFERHTSL